MTRIPERKNVKQIYKWDLTALIDGDAQWETVFGKVKEEAKRLSSFKGALSDDGKLRIEKEDGSQQEFACGDVKLLPGMENGA